MSKKMRVGVSDYLVLSTCIYVYIKEQYVVGNRYVGLFIASSKTVSF
jgi:hypothetical protein